MRRGKKFIEREGEYTIACSWRRKEERKNNFVGFPERHRIRKLEIYGKFLGKEGKLGNWKEKNNFPEKNGGNLWLESSSEPSTPARGEFAEGHEITLPTFFGEANLSQSPTR